MAKDMIIQDKYKFWQSLKRLLRYKLVIPMKRSPHPPHHVARGVGVGMFWAMSPFFGFQMLLSLLTWIITNKIFKWDFSLINACAWTWTTNVFTIIPAFYAFYVTGLICFGELDKAGYSFFYNEIFNRMTATAQLGYWEQVKSVLYFLFSDIGIPLSVGSAIWAVVCGLGSYYLALFFVIRYRRLRADRMNKVSS